MVNLILRELEEQTNAINSLMKENKRIRRTNGLLFTGLVLGGLACANYIQQQDRKIKRLKEEMLNCDVDDDFERDLSLNERFEEDIDNTTER